MTETPITETPWLSIVGIGEDGLASLSDRARSLITHADILVGGQRHLDFVPKGTEERWLWRSPISESLELIQAHQGKNICVLATGDPMCYGIGNTLLRRMARSQMTIIPTPSAFSLAAAHLGWDLGQVRTLSLCGRPVETLNTLLAPGVRVLILSGDRTTPEIVAKQITQRGFGPSAMQVLEHLGGPQQRVWSGIAADWRWAVADLNLIALDCQAEPGIRGFSRLAGLPDGSYVHDGQLTKREVRSLTLSTLAPLPGELLWDVGAGCGSIGIEWMRSDVNCRAIAIEARSDRLENIALNAGNLGVPGLVLQPGKAPDALRGLPRPDAIFIGGGLTRDGVFDTCWEALLPGGRLVVNGVTLESERFILQKHELLGGDLTRIRIERTGAIGGFLGWKALAPITQWSVTKI
jgi:precorrin-6B C5,15-methyltransferase / cobalt-precorrin-6B C5,C15-methyltransferase